MRSFLKNVPISICLLIFSCHNRNRTLPNDADSSDKDTIHQHPHDINASRKHLSFLDSVLNGSDFTWKQMKAHTLMDEKFHINNSIYTGDTVYFQNSRFPIGIISCSDRNACVYDYMFIFSKKDGTNTAFKLVKTDCDEEQDVDSWRLGYTVVNDTLFKLKWANVKNSGEENDTIKVIEHFYKINARGKIDSLKGSLK